MLQRRLHPFLSHLYAQQMLRRLCQSQGRLQQLRRLWEEVHRRPELRQQLLHLAKDVRDWSSRCRRARDAGAQHLADRADQHVQALMQQGRQLWGELEQLGISFRSVEHDLEELAKSNTKPSPHRSIDEDWALFEAQQELEKLRRQQGLN